MLEFGISRSGAKGKHTFDQNTSFNQNNNIGFHCEPETNPSTFTANDGVRAADATELGRDGWTLRPDDERTAAGAGTAIGEAEKACLDGCLVISCE